MLKYTSLLFAVILSACSFDIPQDVQCSADEVRAGRTCVGGIWVKDTEAADTGLDSSASDGGGDLGTNPDATTCQPETDSAFCARLSATCDPLTGTDNCGDARTADCGTCAAPLECGAGGTANVCACPGSTDSDVCASLNKNCGSLEAEDPTCGITRTFNCGTCTAPLTCGGSDVDNVCGCIETDADFCLRANTCGATTATDACGIERTVDCGGCPGTETCGGGGDQNTCGCSAAVACDALGYECGTKDLSGTCSNLGNGDCGSCGAGTCTNNLCVCPPGTAFNGISCADIDECLLNTDNCDTNATCANTAGSFSCTCNAGYSGNGVTCAAITVPTVAQVVSATGDIDITTADLAGSTTDVYFVFVSIRTGSRVVDSVTGLGLTWARLDTECDGNDTQRLEVWGARGNATTGGVRVQLSDTPFATVVTALRVTNAAAVGSTGNIVTDNSSSTNNCSNSSAAAGYTYGYTPGSGSLVLTGIATTGRSHTPGANFTELSDQTKNGGMGNNAGLAVMSRLGAGAALQVNGTFSQTSHWASISFEVAGP